MTRETTRRGALLAGGALLAAGSLDASTAGADAGAPSPPALLLRALRVETAAEFAYEHLRHHPDLPAGARATLREIEIHERAHAARLRRELARLGLAAERLPRPPRGLSSGQERLTAVGITGSLARPGDSKHILELLLRVEYALEDAYFRAAGELEDPALASLAAEILAVEAQHTVLLRQLRLPHFPEGAAPDSFVVGPR